MRETGAKRISLGFATALISVAGAAAPAQASNVYHWSSGKYPSFNYNAKAGERNSLQVGYEDGDDVGSSVVEGTAIFGVGGRDRLTANAPFGMYLHGGDDNDTLFATNIAQDRVDCGLGYDIAYVNARDVVSSCEDVRVIQ